MTTHDNGPTLTGWKVERHYPHCDYCLIAANICGCPNGEHLVTQTQAEWNDR